MIAEGLPSLNIWDEMKIEWVKKAAKMRVGGISYIAFVFILSYSSNKSYPKNWIYYFILFQNARMQDATVNLNSSS